MSIVALTRIRVSACHMSNTHIRTFQSADTPCPTCRYGNKWDSKFEKKKTFFCFWAEEPDFSGFFGFFCLLPIPCGEYPCVPVVRHVCTKRWTCGAIPLMLFSHRLKPQWKTCCLSRILRRAKVGKVSGQCKCVCGHSPRQGTPWVQLSVYYRCRLVLKPECRRT